VACFDPYDEVVLSDAVLWDIRSSKIIHRFDRLTRASAGVFHPNGNEIIINSEVWDVRTFKLLRTAPSLNSTRAITFSPNADIMYAIYQKNSDNLDNLQNNMLQEAMMKRHQQVRQKNVFRTIDAVTYQPISTIDLEREIMDLAPSPNGNFVALVMDDAQADSSTCRLYEVGRKRRGGDEDDEDDSDSESDSDMSDSDAEEELEDLLFDDSDNNDDWDELAFDDDDDDDDAEDAMIEEDDDEEDNGWIVDGTGGESADHDGEEWETDDEDEELT
jgi:HIV-1 Vpr-binding protein